MWKFKGVWKRLNIVTSCSCMLSAISQSATTISLLRQQAWKPCVALTDSKSSCLLFPLTHSFWSKFAAPPPLFSIPVFHINPFIIIIFLFALPRPPSLLLSCLVPRGAGEPPGGQAEMERSGGPHSDSGSISPTWERDRRGPPPGPPGPLGPPGVWKTQMLEAPFVLITDHFYPRENIFLSLNSQTKRVSPRQFDGYLFLSFYCEISTLSQRKTEVC